nr:MAG TPA: hypothetical protein [Caudoviricetes sp.]
MESHASYTASAFRSSSCTIHKNTTYLFLCLS